MILHRQIQDVLRACVARFQYVNCMSLELIGACGTSEVVDLLEVLGDGKRFPHITSGRLSVSFVFDGEPRSGEVSTNMMYLNLGCFSKARRLSIEPVHNESRAMTCWPRSNRNWTKCRPRKPAAW